jgi:hypothetical protein
MRFGVLLVGGLLALPAAAGAQLPGGYGAEPSPDLVPYTPFAVTPWVGYRLGHGSGYYFVFTEDGSQYRVSEARGGGAAVGLNVEARISGPLNLVGGVAYSGARQDEITLEPAEGEPFLFQSDGPAVFFAKAGVQYRIPDPIPDNRRFHPAAYVTVAPAVVVMDWPDFDGFGGDVTGSTTSFALNLGVDAVSRIGSRGLALSIGLEDYITFWNQDRTRVRDETLFGEYLETPVVVDYDATFSNLLMLRLGASWRF